jgi:AcrR family transcriptional regulator
VARAPVPEPTDLRLIELTAEHLRRYGLRRTTIMSIAEAAGMSHANVYRYFPSKEALVDSVVEQWLRAVEKGLRDIVEGPDPAVDKLERLAAAVHRAYRRKCAEDPEIFEIFVAMADDGRAPARRHRNRVLSELQRIIEDGMAAGAFEAADQRDALSLFSDALARFLSPHQVRADRNMPEKDNERRFERVLQLALRAVRTGQF